MQASIFVLLLSPSVVIVSGWLVQDLFRGYCLGGLIFALLYLGLQLFNRRLCTPPKTIMVRNNGLEKAERVTPFKYSNF